MLPWGLALVSRDFAFRVMFPEPQENVNPGVIAHTVITAEARRIANLRP